MTLASACQFNALSQSTLQRNVSRSVRYEEEVGGNGSWAAVTMFLCPGEIVASFSVELDLGTEAASRDHTQVTASVLGDISNETVEDTGTRSVDSGYKSVFIQYLPLPSFRVNFTMNTVEQAHYFGSSGFYGTVTAVFRCVGGGT